MFSLPRACPTSCRPACTTTLEEVEYTFVTGPDVPYPDERRRLFTALQLWSAAAWAIWPKAELWINGSFVTHKPWGPPQDVDVCIADTYGRITARQSRAVSLLTLLEVNVSQPSGSHRKIQPFGGMIDGFTVALNVAASVALWDDQWSELRDREKKRVLGRKGYVKVVNPA